MIRFILNDTLFQTGAPAGRALLDVIRDEAGLTGPKRVCGEGDCGACTVLLGRLVGRKMVYQTAASCIMPVAEAHGLHVVTVEGLNPSQGLNPVQQALVDAGGVQCGFCTPGMVMALTGFLITGSPIDADEARTWIEGNLCRCTGYAGIHRAAVRLAQDFAPLLEGQRDRLPVLMQAGVLPRTFADMPKRIRSLVSTAMEELDIDALPMAGATDLFVQRQTKLEEVSLRLLSREAIRDDLWVDGDDFFMGGLATVEALRRSPLTTEHLPDLPQALRLVSSTLIRQRATVAGNLVNASPIGDLAVILLALDAELGLALDDALRRLPLSRFFKAYRKVDLAPGELIAWIRVPLMPERRLHFEKVSRRQHLDIATVNTACAISVDNGTITSIKLSAGGVAPVPLLLERTADALRDRPLTVDTLRQASEQIPREIAPISDVRGASHYKSRLLLRLYSAHFLTLFPSLGLEEAL